MWLDKYGTIHNNCEGVLNSAGIKDNKLFALMFDSGYPDDTFYYRRQWGELRSFYDNELAIQKDRYLGERISQFDWDHYIGRTIRTIRIDDVLKFYDCTNSNDTPTIIGIVSIVDNVNQWSTTEEDELWKYYRAGYSEGELAKLFVREKDAIEKRIKEYASRVSRIEVAPEGIKSFFKSSFFPATTEQVIIGVVNRGFLAGETALRGGVMKQLPNDSVEELDFNRIKESLFGKVKTTRFGNNEAVRTDIFFKVSAEKGQTSIVDFSEEENEVIKKGIGEEWFLLDKEEKENLQNDHYFLDICKDRLCSSSDNCVFFVWCRFEDFEDSQSNAYYYAASTSLGCLFWFTASDSTVSFLRYIIYLKTVQSKEEIEWGKEQEIKARKGAIKSAISAIMTRNMSHNLGSHVLYYTQRDLLDAAEKQSDDSVKICLRGASFISAFIKNRTNYIAAVSEDSKLPSLPVSFKQDVFDILTVDEDEKTSRINYYLKNLVRSEGFSRDKDNPKENSSLQIVLNVDDLKERLEIINVAFPGGVLSTHAFFNIIENFIRNSAKYWSSQNQREELALLKFTIKLTINDQGQLQVVIYDNKGEAESIITKLQESINNVIFLNQDNSINKENKGIKEMLLSYLWLQSNTFEDSLSSIIYRIDKREKDALDIKNGIKYVAVNDKGQVAENPSSHKGLNLGLCFSLPLHFPEIEITDENAKSLSYGFSADIITTTKEIAKANNLSGIFTRLFLLDNQYEWTIDKTTVIESNPEAETLTQHLYASICDHFKTNIDQFKLGFGDYNEGMNDISKLIFIKHHLNNKTVERDKLLSYYNNYLYVDSESGANYTKILYGLLQTALERDGINNSNKTKTWKEKYIALKIKESALTRITIIDERLFLEVRQWIDLDEMSDRVDFKGSQLEYSLKNIRVLNWAIQQEDGSIKVFNGEDSFKAADGNIKRVEQNKTEQFPCFCGNEFRSVGPYGDCPNKTHFISIHLGIIQKIFNESPSFADDVKRFMEYIKLIFQPDFICVHSGRGGLSSEMENTVLSDYPLIPFVALESAFNDSKFLLAQLFYSLKYKKTIGGSHDKIVKK